MMKKVLVLFITILLLMSMVSCSKSPEESTSNNSSSNTTSEGKTIIKYAGGTRHLEWAMPKAEEYMEANKDIVIEFDEVLAKDADLYTKLTMMMQSPQTSPDIITEDSFMVISDAEAGYLHPLDDMLSQWDDFKNFDEAILVGAQGVDGKQYGIPYSTDVQGIWYSKVLLKEAGVDVPFEPKNWEDILVAAEKIKALNKEETIPLYMYASKTQPEQTSMRSFQVLYSGTGGELYDFDEEKWVYDKEKVVDTLKFIDDIYNNKEVGPPLSVASMNGIDNILTQEYLPSHRLGIYISGSWIPQNWTETGRKPWPEALDEIGFTKIPTQNGQEPGFTTMSGGWTYAIPENAQNKEAAFEFLKFLTNKENIQSINLFNSEVTTRKDVAESPEYLESFSVNREASDMISFTHFRPSVSDYPSVSLILTEITESVAIKAATPEEAAEMYLKELTSLVGEENIITK